jgi:hypothetical protein
VSTNEIPQPPRTAKASYQEQLVTDDSEMDQMEQKLGTPKVPSDERRKGRCVLWSEVRNGNFAPRPITRYIIGVNPVHLKPSSSLLALSSSV